MENGQQQAGSVVFMEPTPKEGWPKLSAIVHKVRQLAALLPTFVYTANDGPMDSRRFGGGGCYNNPTPNNPLGCIVGAAFALCGHPLVGKDSAGEVMNKMFGFYTDHPLDIAPGEEATFQAIKGWLNSVQDAQDRQRTWADAVEQADKSDPLPVLGEPVPA